MSRRPLRVFNVVGARPNMMKMAPVMAEMRRHPELAPVLVHTGQHYDFIMSEVFLQQLQLGTPDYNLNVGSGSHHVQTAQVLNKFGDLISKERPGLIVVAGDVNSTMACALAGVKENIPVAHVESGLRSLDRTMPEEINRIVTDSVADLLFTTEKSGTENLLREGVAESKIAFVGNTMIDSLVAAREALESSAILKQLSLQSRGYALVTLHRPSNVDRPEALQSVLGALAEIGKDIAVVFPAHPRTQSQLVKGNSAVRQWQEGCRIENGIWIIPPAPYLEFLSLMRNSALVITDSGGIQEETSYLRIPCLTYRENTERPITVELGTNELVGTNPQRLVARAREVLQGKKSPGSDIPLWDGKAAGRIVKEILERFCN